MTGLLLTTLILPLTGAISLLVGRRMLSRDAARKFALIASLATLVISLALAKQYVQLPADAAPRSPVQPRFSQAYHWLSYGDVFELNQNDLELLGVLLGHRKQELPDLIAKQRKAWIIAS